MKTYSKTTRGIIAIVLTICFAVGAFLPAKPAHAILGMGDTVSDFTTEIETSLSAVYNALSSAYEDIASYAEDEIWIKDYILDPLAWAAAKSLLQNITNATVSWINSGFNGSPAYITNPTAFFENVGDQAAGAFLSSGGPLSSLCSPISLNVRLAIALNLAGGRANSSGGSNGSNSPYACTLSTVINNVQGATINGFEAGDFSQGGWPAFASLAEPQNNFYGAYLEAQAEIDVNIGNRKTEQNNQLNRGSGFLSFTTCTDDPTITDEDATYDPSIQYDSATNVYQHCNISTPGSTIKSSLDKALGTSQDSLVQASMLDEVIGALASQLVNKVLGPGGLAGVSQSQNGQPAYLSQVEAESNASNAATIANLGATLKNQISTYEPYAIKQQGDYAASVDSANGAIDTFNNYLAVCQHASTTALTLQAISILNGYIATTTNLLNTSLQAGYDSTTNYINNLNSLNYGITNASSTSDINTLTQEADSIQPPLNDMPVSESSVRNNTTDPANSSISSLVTEADSVVAGYCRGTPNDVTVSGTALQNYTRGTNTGSNIIPSF